MTKRREPGNFDVGYAKPPENTRFKKGASGNPRGRPRGSKRVLPYEAMLGQMVTIRENGRERRVDASEAFLAHLTQKGLGGDRQATRAAVDAIEKARSLKLMGTGAGHTGVIEVAFVSPGSVNSALEPLRMGTQRDRYRSTARMILEPWLVEYALTQLGEKRLSPEEQRIVVGATRTPHKVAWPKWWKVKE